MIEAVQLNYTDAPSLVIESDVFDAKPLLELGYLIFSSTPLVQDERIDQILVPLDFRLPIESQSLTSVYEKDPEIQSESGIALKYADGHELIIAAAAFPCTVTISASFITEKFVPEFPADLCARRTLQMVKG
jgi:hypothetical protein